MRSASQTRVVAVFGTRPEAIKLFSPIRALRARPSVFDTIVCSTGQHRELLQDALNTFDIAVDHELATMRHDQAPADVAWRVGAWVTDLTRALHPDVVLVQGDTTTAMAAGVAGFYAQASVAHVEAGLRTYDNAAPWPEEAHRRILGAVADIHFAPSESAAANLLREGISEECVHVTGNTSIDALQWALDSAGPRPVPDGARRVVVTAHRRESIPHGVRSIAAAVRTLAERFPDVLFEFVVHPHPGVERAVADVLAGDRPTNVSLLSPRRYVDFVQMLADCFCIITDSGGIQEEGPALGKPVLVANDRTARHEPLHAGTARLVGSAADDIVAAASRLFSDPLHYAEMATRHDPYGDGNAGERIATLLASRQHVLAERAGRAATREVPAP